MKELADNGVSSKAASLQCFGDQILSPVICTKKNSILLNIITHAL